MHETQEMTSENSSALPMLSPAKPISPSPHHLLSAAVRFASTRKSVTSDIASQPNDLKSAHVMTSRRNTSINAELNFANGTHEHASLNSDVIHDDVDVMSSRTASSS